ncbi:AMP deaminase 2-like isoform X2 [Aedes albopictus]|uniref:Secreted protein n=1 Tax=Aedes albopictus TaxID=7160 RepID=A0ABM1XTN5_AEDAL
MSARGMLLKIDARRDSSLDQLDMMLSPRSPQILINDYFSPEVQGNESPGIHTAAGAGAGGGGVATALGGTLSLSQENLAAGLPNEISAPYEVPQFPIEQIENKLQLQRQLNAKVMEQDRHSVAAEIHPDEQIPFDEHDFVAHFQRVSISGEDTSGVPLDDLERASALLVKALELRERYMRNSYQCFPQTTGRFLKSTRPERYAHQEKKSIAG